MFDLFRASYFPKGSIEMIDELLRVERGIEEGKIVPVEGSRLNDYRLLHRFGIGD